MDLKEQILVALGLNKKDEEVKLAWQSKSEDGTIFVSTAEELEAGVDISVLTEDGTTILLPVGTYKTDTGVSFRVETEGIVAEVIESETEEEIEASEELSEETSETELAEEDKDEYDEEAAVYDWEGMEKRIKNLEDAVADLKRDKVGGDDEVEEMSEATEEPSTNPKSIKTTEVVEFSAEEVAAIKAENEKLKDELAKSPADSPLNTNKFSSEKSERSFRRGKLTKREKILMAIENNK
jgi:alkylhydroperoxidase/carboxymuconolactone decarboxylase family protein YurZ